MKINAIEHRQIQAVAQSSTGRGVRIDIRALTKSYSGRTVLKSADLHIEAGEFVAVVGRSGCGKSTLLRLISGLEIPDGGAIAFTVGDGSERKPETRIMFQDSRLLPWKRVLGNVALGLPQGAGRAAQALGNVDGNGRRYCPAASVSVSHSRGRWCMTPSFCCSTNRSVRSMH